ncbi:uncharacterized protein LOC129593145 [Paramacrobiotus metropolitanus]|uniref:uncharacterized protein LOC129593145 n=1 Tax=Paramacrobiotus metropolitanus TaxID=2943436 RepID=UPI0024460293|nr:uncharacterized protein LOC129593145 [Paramacrobiotus metropolitanus]XP_055345327.1 uncharacterized protein LOC129593145 [Paramacrobiotus metropolitanus]XP_055345333.1 uncharacterized protein LOC129593145 [Paramacrobiotus metropolitanus]
MADESIQQNGDGDAKNNIFVRGLKQHRSGNRFDSAPCSTPSSNLPNAVSSKLSVQARCGDITHEPRVVLSPADILKRHREHAEYQAKLLAKKKAEEDELSDSDVSLQWDADYRDADVAKQTRKANTKSQRRKNAEFKGKSDRQKEDELRERQLKGEDIDFEALKDPSVPYSPYSGDFGVAPHPRYIASYMDVYRTPVGERMAVKIVGYVGGVLSCTWDEIDAERTEYEKLSMDLEELYPAGVDPWEVFPGEIVEVQEGTGKMFKRGIISECFKRAQLLDILLVDYGSRTVRIGAELVRQPRQKILYDPRWRKFYVCFFKPTAPLVVEQEELLRSASPETPVPADVLCHEQKGRICIGDISLK